MVNLRKDTPEISYGDWEIIDTDTENMLAMRYQWDERKLIIIHNLSPNAQKVNFSREKVDAGRLQDMLNPQSYKPRNKTYTLDFDGYASKWLRFSD